MLIYVTLGYKDSPLRTLNLHASYIIELSWTLSSPLQLLRGTEAFFLSNYYECLLIVPIVMVSSSGVLPKY